MISVEQVKELEEKVQRAVNLIKEVREENRSLKKEIQEGTAHLDSLRAEVSELTEERENLKSEVASFQGASAEVERSVLDVLSSLDHLDSQDEGVSPRYGLVKEEPTTFDAPESSPSFKQEFKQEEVASAPPTSPPERESAIQEKPSFEKPASKEALESSGDSFFSDTSEEDENFLSGKVSDTLASDDDFGLPTPEEGEGDEPDESTLDLF